MIIIILIALLLFTLFRIGVQHARIHDPPAYAKGTKVSKNHL